ncbi:MAG: DUF4234 domain-containing protein [Clostridia bacterium]|nr:DUF4234 domain-containing protein [Clostridia bacterium]
MAFCTKCGANIPEGSNFCTSCGEPVSAQGAGQANNQQQNYQQPVYANQGAPVGPISFGQRNIAVAIILSIITCGIYGIYWLIKLVDELNEASGNMNGTSGGMVFLLSLITCGIYGLYWYYKAGEMVNQAKYRRNMYTDSSSGIVYLLLGIFGLGIITYALIQNELNKIAAFHGAPAA